MDLKYDWQHADLSLERQQEILEKRREYLLQLMPDDLDCKEQKGSQTGLTEEWNALQLHRDKLLRASIDKENIKALDTCYLNLLCVLTRVGTFDHSSTSLALKTALYTLYWELKRHFNNDVDISNRTTILAEKSPSKQIRKKKKSKTKLSKPDLIPTLNLTCESLPDNALESRPPKRGKFKPRSVVCERISSESTPLLSTGAHAEPSSLSSDWESIDEFSGSFEGLESPHKTTVDDLDRTASLVRVSFSETDSTISAVSRSTPVSQGIDTPAGPDVPDAAITPVHNMNVSFAKARGAELATPQSSSQNHDFGKTPVSTRTPLIRGIVSYTPAPSPIRSVKRPVLYQRTPYKGSPTKRKGFTPHSSRRTISSKFTENPVPLKKTAAASGSDVTVDMETAAEMNLTTFNKRSDQEENAIEVNADTPDRSLRYAGSTRFLEAGDMMAIALKKKFKNYRCGGVYTSPVKDENLSSNEHSFNISID